MCRSSSHLTKKVHEREHDKGREELDEVLFLGEVVTAGGGWTKLDTSVAVTVIGAQTLWLKDQGLRESAP